jgi:predicted Fe-Mo cluster-binding NifX family protein
VDGLVCGFIAERELLRLRAAGIDVRLGAGGRSVEELKECFCHLPHARPLS